MHSAPMFKLQIVENYTGRVLEFEGGGKVEMDLIESIVQAVMRRGVGMWRTQAHVEQDLRDGIQEAIHGLKTKTIYFV